jgi:hypothetical protein
MEPSTDLRRAFRATVLVSGAVIATLFVYAVVVEVIKSVLRPFTGVARPSDLQTLRYLAYGLAVLVVILIRVLSRALIKSGPGESEQIIVRKLSQAGLVVSFLAEVPAVLGLIFFLLTGISRDFYYLLFVSLFLEFMYFPRISTWETQAKMHSAEHKS